MGIGPLVDRFVPHRLLVLPMTSMAFACLFVGMVASTIGAFVYGLALGFAYGSFQAVNAAIYAHYFGRKHAGEIRGVTFVITIVGAALGPLPFGWAAQRTAGTFPSWLPARSCAPLPSQRTFLSINRRRFERLFSEKS